MRLSWVLTASTIAWLSACIEYNPPLNAPRWPDSEARPLPLTVQEDVILQTTTPVIDVLFTIDNSCSMQDNQEALAANFPSFMNFFFGSGLDYHIGVISTDLANPLHQGKLQGLDTDGNPGTPGSPLFIDVSTPDPVDVFGQMAALGTGGTGDEMGIGAVYLALEDLKDTANAGFFRDDASIHTVVISDELDHTEPTLVSKREFIDWYSGLKRSYDDRTFSSIVHTDPSDNGFGEQYIDVTNDVGGILWNIESADWDVVLEQLGVHASGLKREYFLSQIPVPSTIEVEVETPDGTVLPFTEAVGDPPVGGYTYSRSRNSVTFVEFMPESLSRVVIRYVLLSSLEEDEAEEITLPD